MVNTSRLLTYPQVISSSTSALLASQGGSTSIRFGSFYVLSMDTLLVSTENITRLESTDIHSVNKLEYNIILD